MSFLKKLKDRMFKSASKLDEGLDAIIEAAPDDAGAAPVASTAPKPTTTPQPADSSARRVLDDAMLESLEELLIASDMGVDTALRVAANIAEGRFGRRISVPELKTLLAAEITRIMDPVAKPMPLYPQKPQVVLVVGVNGSGKTTTIGKLASQFKAAGKSVVIAAGDTFRAAAVEQLQIWGDRAGVPVLTAPEGSDPASLAFDAIGAGDMADTLLAAMERAFSRSASGLNTYGSDQFKQVYVYGRLGMGQITLGQSYGMHWACGGYLLTPNLQKMGPEKLGAMQARVADEIKTTFASHITDTLSLLEAIDPANIARYMPKKTGEKYVIQPQKDL